MAHVVILGAGLGGMPMAYEMKQAMRKDDRLTVVGNGPNFHFVPSNPWVAVGWRTRGDIEFPAGAPLAKRGIAFEPAGAKRVHPAENRVELSGIDREVLGQLCAVIRDQRPPEPYKGKGIKYTEETILRKVGKAGVGSGS